MSDGLLKRLQQFVHRDDGDAGEEAAPSGIKLVVGLGNPGKEYADNRHNVGFWTVNRLARRRGIKFDTSSQSALGKGRIAGREVAIAKPRTFVNKSGEAVWNLIKRLKLDDARELLVVYDDIDLPTGKIRLRARGGSGGYKGLQSIIDATGSDHFARLRIGIGRPLVGGQPTYDPEEVGDYVLSDPPPEERKTLDEAVDRAIAVIELVLAEDVQRAMARFN